MIVVQDRQDWKVKGSVKQDQAFYVLPITADAGTIWGRVMIKEPGWVKLHEGDRSFVQPCCMPPPAAAATPAAAAAATATTAKAATTAAPAPPVPAAPASRSPTWTHACQQTARRPLPFIAASYGAYTTPYLPSELLKIA